jgi:hypothetical protein
MDMSVFQSGQNHSSFLGKILFMKKVSTELANSAEQCGPLSVSTELLADLGLAWVEPVVVCNLFVNSNLIIEPRHDKTNIVHLRPAWIQTSLPIP